MNSVLHQVLQGTRDYIDPGMGVMVVQVLIACRLTINSHGCDWWVRVGSEK